MEGKKRATERQRGGRGEEEKEKEKEKKKKKTTTTSKRKEEEEEEEGRPTSTGQVNEITRNRKLSGVRILLERPLPTQKSLPRAPLW